MNIKSGDVYRVSDAMIVVIVERLDGVTTTDSFPERTQLTMYNGDEVYISEGAYYAKVINCATGKVTSYVVTRKYLEEHCEPMFCVERDYV